ncbi:cysteine--tRNA ligase [Candidatus Velamenicoccus archaeovorus]|uniref:Cysteine--tRNA ligase n=1 Tax=Velamenicoccus archaeovorus TaxID=1930593 RepID=A0A410P5H6_VELA1|nr:cysteine--tRNA ligase [Candidatus Velamenicoccus archaeovorus]QAT17338.1 cysteine--tRNA ligase [Candidatus Velamenicoccus archaeovorus]
MMVSVYNSLSRKKEDLVPCVPGKIKMYTCGVTVYDDCHVGHARSLYIFDVIKKYLEYRGFRVTLVRNITDVDDKIINRARQDGVAFDEIRVRYIGNYERDLAALGIARADVEPLATENIPGMIAHIGKLIAKGAAYVIDGDVYFSVRLFKDYGKLSGQTLDEMMTAVRIEKDEKKKDPLDFALWKKSKEGEPSWPSPWGPGRPGWHIECSTMSMHYLKTESLDIHAGGLDLIFPHHENEIAQAEALTGKPFAKYWIHHGLLTIDGRKMSKSLGNFYTIQDVLKQFSPDILKLFFLSAHYRSPIDFTFDGLKNSRKALDKMAEFVDKAHAARRGIAKIRPLVRYPVELQEFRRRFEEAMDDDFNTAQGLAVLFDIVNSGNKLLSSSRSRGVALQACRLLLELAEVFGLKIESASHAQVIDASVRLKTAPQAGPEAAALLPEDVKRLVQERQVARQKKDFKRADEIRDYLKVHGVTIEDTRKAG